MPKDWGDNGDRGKYWVPEYLWHKFENTVARYTKQEFNGEFDTIKPVMILKPPTSKYVKAKLDEVCHRLQGLVNINEEACRKALTTTQLDSFSMSQRKEFVEINMRLDAKFSFREELKKSSQA